MKGQSLEPGQVVVLSLDGSLVFCEDVQKTHAAVICLPEQPAERQASAVFTPGKVGAKKISPLAGVDKVVPRDSLTPRNVAFLDTYETARGQHGAFYINDEELRKAAEASAALPSKDELKEQTRLAREARTAERKEAKAARKGPKFLQRCATCGEQPGHPNHGEGDTKHIFVGPELPKPLCAGCDKLEDDGCHAAGQPTFTHRFMAGKAAKPTREPREPKEAKAPREPRERKAKPNMVDINTKFRWVENELMLAALIAGNGKFSASNSGGAMIATIKAAGATGITVVELIVKHPRPIERLQLAFGQLQGAGLLEAC